jgi:hypothetical protein
MLVRLMAEREQASADLDFERAAALHTQVQKVKAAIALADELVAPISKLRAVVVQKAAWPLRSTARTPEADSSAALRNDKGDVHESAPEPALSLPKGLDSKIWEQEPTSALFLLEGGCIVGPVRLSTLGVRAVREQTAVGSSLYAQPLMLEAVPLAEDANASPLAPTPAESPEARAAAAIAILEAQTTESVSGRPTDPGTLSDHLSLLRRWYYRPEKQRVGEVFFPRDDGSWPLRRILRGAARMALGEPAPLPEVRRELAEKNPADTLPSDSAPL